jgi:hypothetical protein
MGDLEPVQPVSVKATEVTKSTEAGRRIAVLVVARV